jgi:hypothetical protein
MDSIPRITSFFDFRNVISIVFYTTLCRIVMTSILDLKKSKLTEKCEKKLFNKSHHKRKSHAASSRNNNNFINNNNNNISEQTKVEQTSSIKDDCLAGISDAKNMFITNEIDFNQSEIGSEFICNRTNQSELDEMSFSPLKKYIRKNAIIDENNNNDNNNNNFDDGGKCMTDDNNNELIANSDDNNNGLLVNNNYNDDTDNNNKNDINYNYNDSANNNNINYNKNNNEDDNYSNSGETLHKKASIKVCQKREKIQYIECAKLCVNKLIESAKSLYAQSMAKSSNSKELNVKMDNTSAILLSIAIIVLSFLPAANLFFYVGFVVAERILYLPSVGYCLLIGLSIGKIVNFKVRYKKNLKLKRKHENFRQRNSRSIAIVIVLTMVISTFSLKTIKRNRDWFDEESLYRSAIHVNPPKGRINVLAIKAYK